MEKNLVIIRLRGRTGIRADVESTLKHLNLNRINNCVVLSESTQVLGMVRKAKDYITWGHIDAETLTAMVSKRGRLVKESDAKNGSKVVSFDGKAYERYFRLNPAKGGLGSRGIKATFAKAGALGDRKEKINDLLKKMI